MASPGFRPLLGTPECDRCVGVQQAACRTGDHLTFVREATDLFPTGVRVYVHPPEIDLEGIAELERARYRGPFLAACLNRCDVRAELAREAGVSTGLHERYTPHLDATE